MNEKERAYYTIKAINIIAKRLDEEAVESACYYCGGIVKRPTTFVAMPLGHELFISHSKNPIWIPYTYFNSLEFLRKRLQLDIVGIGLYFKNTSPYEFMKYIMHDNCFQAWELLPNE